MIEKTRSESLLDYTSEELEQKLVSLGQKGFRARQILDWVYNEMIFDYSLMTNLPKSLRESLAAELPILPLLPEDEVSSDSGMTRKSLLRLHDTNAIEAVLMLYPGEYQESGRGDGNYSRLGDEDEFAQKARRTVCVSSQVGCAVGCPFCATGMSGLLRNLSTAEIVGQVLYFAGLVRQIEDNPEARLTNIVFMGQGEPLANFGRVWKAVEILNSPDTFGLGARHITISTSGIVPGIDALAEKPLQVGLAISLHAPDDALRDRLVPMNRRYPIRDLLAACWRYVEKKGRRVTFEYAMMNGVNDTPEMAERLGTLLRGRLAHVNLIPLNRVEGSPFSPTPWKDLLAFQSIVNDAGVSCTVRVERGDSIAAACGQLRARRGQNLILRTPAPKAEVLPS